MGRKQAFINLVYILLFISTGYFATDIYLPSLPSITSYFNTTDNLVQFTLFFYLLSFAFAPLICGPLSDHYGRKKIILFGMILCVLSSVGCYFSPSIYILIFFRFIQGFGSGAVIVAGRSVLTDSFTGQNLAEKISIITLSIPLFLALAPFIGGIFQEHFGWQSVFLFLIFYFFSILCATYLFKESLQKPTEYTTLKFTAAYKSLLKNKSFILYAIGFIIPNMGIFGYLAVSPFIFQNLLGLTAAQYGLLAIFTGLVIILFSIINIQLIKHFSINSIILIGTFMIFISGFLLIIFHSLNLFTFLNTFIPCLIFYISAPFCLSNSMAKTMQQISRNFGSANALLSTMQVLGGSLATFLFSFIEESSALPLALFFVALAVLNVLFLFFAHKSECKKS